MCVALPWRRAYMLLLLLLTLMSCGTANTAASGAPTTITPAPTIPDTATTCAQVAEVAGGQHIALSNLNFPDDGIATSTVTSAPAAPFQVTAYIACFRLALSAGPPTPMGTVIDQVQEALGFLERGWARSKVFPVNGNTLTTCTTDQRCFVWNQHTYALLEQARENANGLVVFALRVALPPS
jgi:hypothetical protein